MKEEELKNIYGGVSFSATLVNAIVRGITALYEIGRNLASAIMKYRCNN